MLVQDFIDNLKDHILHRIHHQGEWDGEIAHFTDAAQDNLIIVQNSFYEHKTLSINYSTYDLRRDQDVINPRTRADIMVLSHETDSNRHPYWYARVLKIFHVNVQDYGDGSSSDKVQGIDVLFVCWFGRHITHSSVFQSRCLPHVGFLSEEDPDAFGFLDPDVVIGGVHLIPSFLDGRTSELLPGRSITRQASEGNSGWASFEVNM